MLLILFRYVAHLAQWNFYQNQAIICVYDLFVKNEMFSLPAEFQFNN